jgi:hypothetical protein
MWRGSPGILPEDGFKVNLRVGRLRASVLLMHWAAVAAVAISLAGCGKDRRDALILRDGTKLQGTLTGCDAKGCTLDGKTYPRPAIDWIGLASGDEAPPKVEHPEADEEHLRDGSVRTARLLGVDARAVVVASASLPRAQVAFVHLARPSAASVPPGQTDQPKPSSRVLHFSVRVKAHSTHYNEGNKGFPSHYLHDTNTDWTGVWPDVAVEINEATARIDMFHMKGTPYPDMAAGEITASLAYHMIFSTAAAGRLIGHECAGALAHRVYPVRLVVSGLTKSGSSRFVVSTWPLLPAGLSDPELLGQQRQDPDRDCEITGPEWPAWRTFRIPRELDFEVKTTDLNLKVHRENSPELFFPLDAILADRSFTLETGPQREEIPPRQGWHDETKNEWQAKIEFTALGGGTAPGAGSPR